MYLSFTISTRDSSELEKGWKDNLFQHSTYGKSSAALFVMQEWLVLAIFLFHSGPENNQHISFGKNDVPLHTR